MAALNGRYALFYPFTILFLAFFLLFRCGVIRMRLFEWPDARCRGWRSSYGSKMAPKHESWRRWLSSEAFLYDTDFFSRPTCHVAAVFQTSACCPVLPFLWPASDSSVSPRVFIHIHCWNVAVWLLLLLGSSFISKLVYFYIPDMGMCCDLSSTLLGTQRLSD